MSVKICAAVGDPFCASAGLSISTWQVAKTEVMAVEGERSSWVAACASSAASTRAVSDH